MNWLKRLTLVIGTENESKIQFIVPTVHSEDNDRPPGPSYRPSLGWDDHRTRFIKLINQTMDI